MSMPSYGQRSDPRAAPDCPRHPGVRSVDYCKRCNRPMCMDCAIPTEVRSICVDCASPKRVWARRASRVGAAGAPVVTYSMMAICVLMYVVTSVSPSLKASLSLVPATLASRPWTILTGAFLHHDFMHILFNMLSVYWVGRAIEPVMGRWRFLTLYLVSALGGSAFILAWCLIQPSEIFVSTVGASGAVFGLFGAVFVLQRLGGSDTTLILVLLGISLVRGFTASGISWQGHIGGAIAGVAATWVLARLARPCAGVTEAAQNRRQALAAFGMIAGMVALNSLVFHVLVEVYGA
ncbi:rhomboid family intramembrane serine protease [Actinomyces bouchesdurhonensis]|uniref:rhomboid family intramembrane serine protease n=1 Tax=Actinomyces bouchesdurhonensis TaxID=1852361 RepID=UPI0028E49A21|nr:rhomboid family intramembrane serine protease [Actinomyces bouchesdurhonensis]